MQKPPPLIQPDSLLQFRRLIVPRFELLSRDRPSEQLIPFNSLSGQYQVSEAILWDCLLALQFIPQEINGQPHFTIKQIKRLEQFIKRIEIAWDCLKIF